MQSSPPDWLTPIPIYLRKVLINESQPLDPTQARRTAEPAFGHRPGGQVGVFLGYSLHSRFFLAFGDGRGDILEGGA